MAPSLHYLLTFSLTVSLLTTTTLSRNLHNSSDTDMINSLCSQTDYPKLCISTIQSYLPAPEPLCPTTVLKLAMKAVRSKSYAAKSVAKELYHNNTNKLAAGPLKDCLDLYDDVAYSIHKADEAIRVHDKGTVGSELSAVATFADTCDEGFLEFELPNPMKKYDDLLEKLAEICLVIAQEANLV